MWFLEILSATKYCNGLLLGRAPMMFFFTMNYLQIKRIQNPYLYQQYAVKKAHIEQHVDQSKCKVKQDLWHGTTPTAIRSINYHGFNRRYCGNNCMHSLLNLNFFSIDKYRNLTYLYAPNLLLLRLKEGA